MKLINARLCEQQIREKMWKVWYDERYQFYFNGNYRNDFRFEDDSGGCPHRGFGVLNNDNELIGYIDYFIDMEMRIVQWFGAINFSDDKLTFGMALKQVISDCFLKYGMEVLEWEVVCGNPIEKSYDRMCEKVGGHIVGVRHRRIKDMAGNIHDIKRYEVLREDFLKAMEKK